MAGRRALVALAGNQQATGAPWCSRTPRHTYRTTAAKKAAAQDGDTQVAIQLPATLPAVAPATQSRAEDEYEEDEEPVDIPNTQDADWPQDQGDFKSKQLYA